MLLYGPPGTGKSYLLGAAAKYITDHYEKSAFFSVKSGDLSAGLRGLPSKKLMKILDAAVKYENPVVMIDECEMLFARRDGDNKKSTDEEATQTLMQYMSGAAEKAPVSIWGATNYPWRLDKAVLDRLENTIFMPLPTTETLHTHLMQKADLAYFCPDADPARLIGSILFYMEHASYRDMDDLIRAIQRAAL